MQSDDYSEGPAARDLLARANLSDRGDVESTDDEIRRNFASPFDIRYGKDDDDDDEPEDDVYSDEDLELHSDDSLEEAVEDIQKAHPKSNGTRRMRRSTLA